jgi:hypothetical protein
MPITAYSPLSPESIMGPFCPKCGTVMWIIRIEAVERDHDLLTFECRECQLQETLVANCA